ncbi:TetR/AcrR family transcriptional regulator [Altererythrobacter sp.]|uniref:TetR/AcrR family transcriptional regulator n=1 Tax=Altererythrobacter sp. TaxID=1872480 RepID=UPI003D0373B4
MTKLSAFPSTAELRELKRLEILRCAARRFSERGYEGTSLDQIAKELGVTKTALYHYVPNKKQLLFDCYRQFMELIIGKLDEADAMDASPLDRLRFVLREYGLHAIAGDYQFLWRDARIVLEGDETQFLQTQRDEVDSRIRQFIVDCVEAGQMYGIEDLPIAYFHIMGALNWMAVWYRQGGDLKPEELSERMVAESLKAYVRTQE